MLFSEIQLSNPIKRGTFSPKAPFQVDSSKCFPVKDTVNAPFMQMLFDQCHRLRPHSCKCFQLKAPFYCPIHANAFQLKASSRLIHARGFQRRHLTQTHSSKCFYTKGTFLSPLKQVLFTKVTFLPPLKQMLFTTTMGFLNDLLLFSWGYVYLWDLCFELDIYQNASVLIMSQTITGFNFLCKSQCDMRRTGIFHV